MMVLTVGILSVSRGFSVATLARGLAQDYTDSRYLAAERMWQAVAQAEARNLRLGTTHGKFPQPWHRFSWEQKIEETGLPYRVSANVLDVAELQPGTGAVPRAAIEEQPEEFFARLVVTVKWTRRNVEYTRSVATLVPPTDLDEEMDTTL